jgi:hypothetical protein
MEPIVGSHPKMHALSAKSDSCGARSGRPGATAVQQHGGGVRARAGALKLPRDTHAHLHEPGRREVSAANGEEHRDAAGCCDAQHD